jgi:hypothetical protein
MASKPRNKKNPRTEPDESVAVEAERRAAQFSNSRDEQLCDDAGLQEALGDIYKDVLAGFQDQADRSDDIMDYWDLYNCKMGPRQTYAGNSKVFVPIVRNAITARKTRFTNQVFPQTGRYVECTTSEPKPSDIIALLEHYIRADKLRTRVMPALVKNGDLEGQYSVYVAWTSTTRDVVYRVQKALQKEGQPVPGTEDDDVEEETIERAHPDVEVIADADLLVLPATADSIPQAMECGGSVTIIRRWSKAQIKRKMAEGEIDKDQGDKLLKEFDAQSKGIDGQKDKARAMTDAAGIKAEGGRKFALIYETWAYLTVDDERRIYKIFFGGESKHLGCKRNPFWSDRVPVFSAPIDKVQGSFKGIAPVKACADMQYAANDAVNEGMDSAAYSMLPIIMTDPQKNPRIGSMVLNLAAIWETNPNDTQFAKFPELWKSAFEMVNSCRTEIFQTLSVTPAIMPQSTSMKQKRNQAEIAQEQQVDILSTADAVTVLEEGILTPILTFFAELDHQFRDKPLTVRQYGEMGVRANMQDIPPIQMNHRYEFRWYGVEAARNAQQVQQQIAGMNVIRGIPPEQYAPYKLDLKPVISLLIENTFGPRLAPEIFKDPRSELSQDPGLENQMLQEGFEVPVHPLDDDATHLKAHMQVMQESGDTSGQIRVHMMKHAQQMSMKTQAQMQQGGQGMPGVPGGAGPGVAGTPRQGAQPQGPRPNGQGPAGMIHQDRMQGPGIAPRR